MHCCLFSFLVCVRVRVSVWQDGLKSLKEMLHDKTRTTELDIRLTPESCGKSATVITQALLSCHKAAAN